MNRRTGLAEQMREWMRERRRPFAPRQVCDGLDILNELDRDKVRLAIHDFLKRGEIDSLGNSKFRYNHAWRGQRTGKEGRLRAKILKAMYVSISQFSSSDLQRLSEVPNRDYINRIIRELAIMRYIEKIGQRSAPGGIGTEKVYNIINRDQFRIEVMD